MDAIANEVFQELWRRTQWACQRTVLWVWSRQHQLVATDFCDLFDCRNWE